MSIIRVRQANLTGESRSKSRPRKPKPLATNFYFAAAPRAISRLWDVLLPLPSPPPPSFLLTTQPPPPANDLLASEWSGVSECGIVKRERGILKTIKFPINECEAARRNLFFRYEIGDIFFFSGFACFPLSSSSSSSGVFGGYPCSLAVVRPEKASHASLFAVKRHSCFPLPTSFSNCELLNAGHGLPNKKGKLEEGLSK